MAFIDRLLQEPRYGWANAEGALIRPAGKDLFREAMFRINIFRSKKNWISVISWIMTAAMLPFLYLFLTEYFSWWLVLAIATYSTLIMGTHGTVWFHRFGTHRAFTFSHPLWKVFIQNLVIKTFPEEVYVISHHVHHAKSDQPGDPYNPQGGFMYCMLSDVNHQGINKDLNDADYERASRMLKHTGVRINSYQQYRKWGTITHPLYAVLLWLFNWSLWFIILNAIGGMALVCALFSAAMLWFIFVRAFNYTGHGKGEAKHMDGLDFDRSNLSLNQARPGMLTGEWHNNHHLYPGSARAGFLPGQFDPAWVCIFIMYKLKIISGYHDSKKEFLKRYNKKATIA